MVYVSRIKGLKLSKMLLELFCFNLFEYKNHAMYFRNMENTKVEILKSLEKFVKYAVANFPMLVCQSFRFLLF